MSSASKNTAFRAFLCKTYAFLCICVSFTPEMSRKVLIRDITKLHCKFVKADRR